VDLDAIGSELRASLDAKNAAREQALPLCRRATRLTHALVAGQPLPSAGQIGVDPPAYLNGMGEAVGEMRRHLLDLMRRGALERSEEILGQMDEIYYLLISMDYPDAVTAGLRRTSDAIRGIIERTRGDLTVTLIQDKLRSALEAKHGEA
jgi:translin